MAKLNNAVELRTADGGVFSTAEKLVMEELWQRITRGKASISWHSFHTTTTKTTLDELLKNIGGETILRNDVPHKNGALVRTDEHDYITIDIYHQSNTVQISVASLGLERAKAVTTSLATFLPPIKQTPTTVPVSFWSRSQRTGVTRRTRSLDAPTWDAVESNYPGRARHALDEIIRWDSAPPSGRLLLLHGIPGTGKTYAIRALAREWKKWCEVHYVVDPENFFGDSEYMLSVLIEDEDALQWRLIVIEDCDELIRVDAKRDTGQAMSRLLNVCDGLIGQGLRVLVLVTTNEKIDKLHPAIMRPGRCAANIEVGRFGADEGTLWLKEHGVQVESGRWQPMTLAEMYNTTSSSEYQQILAKDEKIVGF